MAWKKTKDISPKNQVILSETEKLGFGLNDILRKYGVRFTLKLIKSLIKPRNGSSDTSPLISPVFKVLEKNKAAAWEEYLEIVENAGFKFRRWMEDFVDEDTGEVVSIERFEVYYIDHNK